MIGRYDGPVPVRELTLARPLRHAVHLAGHSHLAGPWAHDRDALDWPDVRSPPIRGAARGNSERWPHWR